jgi:hypothetical protein
MGNRANEGYAEMTMIVYNDDGSALFQYGKPAIENNDGWNAGGLTVEVVKPGEEIRTLYDGDSVYLADPRAMKDPGRAFKENPHRRLCLDLRHHGVGPMYGRVADPGEGDDFARAHYEQHMRVEGTIEIEGEAGVTIAGHGLRDHSWGPRYWQSTPSYRWITGNFGDDLGMILRTNGEGKGGGLFHEGDQLIRIQEVSLETEYEPGTNYHSGLRAELTLGDGRKRVLEGTVMGFIPLRNRRSGAHTHIGEGMTEYTLDGDRKGYGLSEYLDNPKS